MTSLGQLLRPLESRPGAAMGLAVVVMALLGVADYAAGFELSFSLFYLAPQSALLPLVVWSDSA